MMKAANQTRLEEELKKAKQQGNQKRIAQVERYISQGAVLHEDGYIRYPNRPSLLGYD